MFTLRREIFGFISSADYHVASVRDLSFQEAEIYSCYHQHLISRPICDLGSEAFVIWEKLF